MVDLQQARKDAADRFTAIGMAYLPEGWTWHVRKSLTGRCWFAEKKIEAPWPRTRKSLYIFLHECAHAHLHQPLWERSPAAYRKKPKHVVEHEAEMWAHAKMREHGVPVPRDMTVRAKAYVARKIRQAVRRGAINIDPAAKAYAAKRKSK